MPSVRAFLTPGPPPPRRQPPPWSRRASACPTGGPARRPASRASPDIYSRAPAVPAVSASDERARTHTLPVPVSPLDNLCEIFFSLPVRTREGAMLLRGASSPLLNAARVPAAEHVGGHLAVVPAAGHRQVAPCRALSEADLLAPVTLTLPLPAARSSTAPVFVEEDEDENVLGAAVQLRRLLTSTGLDATLEREEESASGGDLALLEGVGGGGGGGRVCRGGGDGGDDGRGAADAHYRRMISANPGNSLPLGNYARFLKEVEGDAVRAQEYCERAIVANPGDGDALALYAGLVWETSRDAERADAYYSRAVQAAPDDCYVLGSYAGFLWDAEEEDDLTDEQTPPATPPFFDAAEQPPSIRAAS